MSMDFATDLQSQDVLLDDSYVEEFPSTDINKEPWIKEWACEDVSPFETRWNATAPNSSLTLEEVVPFFLVDNISFPLSEILTDRGINVLMQKAMEELIEMQNNPSTANPIAYFRILSFFEFISDCECANVHLISLIIEKLERILKKVRAVEVSGSFLKKNSNFHILIFTWKTIVIVYSKFLELKSTSQDDLERRLENLLMEISRTLVRLHFKFGSVMACECIKGLLTQLFHVQLKYFFHAFLRFFDQSADNTKEQTTGLPCMDPKITDIVYFSFFCDCYEFLLSRKAFDVTDEYSNGFITRIFFIAEKISTRKLISVCEILTRILTIWRPQGLDKQKKSTKQFWLQIAQHFESNHIPQLEHLSKTNSSSWIHEILNSFPQCEPSVVLLRFLSIMFSEKPIWDVSRNIVYNSLNRMKQSSCDASLGSRLSLFFTILNSCADPTELGNRLCEWLIETCAGKELLPFEVYFNAFNVLTDIAERRKISIKSETVLQKIFDCIPLPSNGSIYINRLTLYNDQRTLSIIDFTRPGKLLNDGDFIKLVCLLYQANLAISDSQLTRCLEIMTVNRCSASGKELTDFFVRWLRQGLENNTSIANQYLAKLIRMTLLPDVLPDFIFSITNILLAPPQVVTYLDPFVPCWILASCQFSETHGAELTEMQRNIWPYVKSVLNIQEDVCDSDDPFEYFLLMFRSIESARGDHISKKIDNWFPIEVIKQFSTFLNAGKNESKFQNCLKLTVIMLSHATETLFEMASVSGKSFRYSIFVTLLGLLENNKGIFQPPIPDPLNQYWMKLINNVIRIPFKAYVFARLRQFIIISEKSEFAEKIIHALRDIPNDYYQKLRDDTKTNPALRALIEKYG